MSESSVPASQSDTSRPNRGLSQKNSRGRRSSSLRQAERPVSRRPEALNQLALWYPQIFGHTPRPLKRGVFQDLISAHTDTLAPEALKEALAFHTRSGAYLNAVARGEPRHDLQGQVVEAMAPEHVLHALLEVHRRRQSRRADDLSPALKERLAEAYLQSGLDRDAYLLLVPRHPAQAMEWVLEAMEMARQRLARLDALRRAFHSSGLTAASFAEQYAVPAGDMAIITADPANAA